MLTRIVLAAALVSAAVALRQPFADDRDDVDHSNLVTLGCDGSFTLFGDGVLAPLAMFQVRSRLVTNLLNGFWRATHMAVNCACERDVSNATMRQLFPLSGSFLVRALSDGNTAENDPATLLSEYKCSQEAVDFFTHFAATQTGFVKAPSFVASQEFDDGKVTAAAALPVAANTQLVLSMQNCPKVDPFADMFSEDGAFPDLEVYHSSVTLNCAGQCGSFMRFCVNDGDCAGLGANTCMKFTDGLFKAEEFCVEMKVNVSMSFVDNFIWNAKRIEDGDAGGCDPLASYTAFKAENEVCPVADGYVPEGFELFAYDWGSGACSSRVCQPGGGWSAPSAVSGAFSCEDGPHPCNTSCSWETMRLVENINCVKAEMVPGLLDMLDKIGDRWSKNHACLPHNARLRFPLRMQDGGIFSEVWKRSDLVPSMLGLLAEVVSANNPQRMSRAAREQLIAAWQAQMSGSGAAAGNLDLGMCMFPQVAKRIQLTIQPGIGLSEEGATFTYTAPDGQKSQVPLSSLAGKFIESVVQGPEHKCSLAPVEGGGDSQRIVCVNPLLEEGAANNLLNVDDARRESATKVDPFWDLNDEGVWLNHTDVKGAGSKNNDFATIAASTCGLSSVLLFPGTMFEAQLNLAGVSMWVQRFLRGTAYLLDERVYSLRSTLFPGYEHNALRESVVAALLPFGLHYYVLNSMIDNYDAIGISTPKFLFGKEAARLLQASGSIWTLKRDDNNKPEDFDEKFASAFKDGVVDWQSVFTTSPFVSFELNLLKQFTGLPYGLAFAAQACRSGATAIPEMQLGITGPNPDMFNLRGCDASEVCPNMLLGAGVCMPYTQLHTVYNNMFYGQKAEAAAAPTTEEVKTVKRHTVLSSPLVSRVLLRATDGARHALRVLDEAVASVNDKSAAAAAAAAAASSATATATAAVSRAKRSAQAADIVTDLSLMVRPLLERALEQLDRLERKRADVTTSDDGDFLDGVGGLFDAMLKSVLKDKCPLVEGDEDSGIGRDMFVHILRSIVPAQSRDTPFNSQIGVCVPNFELIEEKMKGEPEMAATAVKTAEAAAVKPPPPTPSPTMSPTPLSGGRKRELNPSDPGSFLPLLAQYDPPPRMAKNDNGILMQCLPYKDATLDAEAPEDAEQFNDCQRRGASSIRTEEGVSKRKGWTELMWVLIALAIVCCLIILALILAFLLVRRYRKKRLDQQQQQQEESSSTDGRRTPRSRNPNRRSGRMAGSELSSTRRDANSTALRSPRGRHGNDGANNPMMMMPGMKGAGELPMLQQDANGNLMLPRGMVPMPVRAPDGTMMMMLVPMGMATQQPQQQQGGTFASTMMMPQGQAMMQMYDSPGGPAPSLGSGTAVPVAVQEYGALGKTASYGRTNGLFAGDMYCNVALEPGGGGGGGGGGNGQMHSGAATTVLYPQQIVTAPMSPSLQSFGTAMEFRAPSSSPYGDVQMDDSEMLVAADGQGASSTMHTAMTMQRANSAGRLPPMSSVDPGDAARNERTQYGAPPLPAPPTSNNL